MAGIKETINVLINNINITEHVISIDNVPVLKTEYGEILSVGNIAFTLDNQSGAFGTYTQPSIFAGKKLDDINIKITRNYYLIFEGLADDITQNENDKTTSITAKSVFDDTMDSSAMDFTDFVLPSVALKQILEYYNINLDERSFSVAGAELNEIPVLVKVNPDVVEWQGTLSDLIQPLLVACVGRLYYTEKGSVGLDVYSRTRINPVAGVIPISDSDFANMPEVSMLSREQMHGYTIEYLGGKFEFQKYTALKNKAKMQTLNFSSSSAVIVGDPATAEYIGSTWVDYSRRKEIEINVDMLSDISYLLKMNRGVKITSGILAMSNREGYIMSIQNNNAVFSNVTMRIIK